MPSSLAPIAISRTMARTVPAPTRWAASMATRSPSSSTSATRMAAAVFTSAGLTMPSAANNGTARLSSMKVLTANSFGIRLDTAPVTLEAPFGEVNAVRDFDADGDQAVVRVDDGSIPNLILGVVTNPSDVSYGFGQ